MRAVLASLTVLAWVASAAEEPGIPDNPMSTRPGFETGTWTVEGWGNSGSTEPVQAGHRRLLRLSYRSGDKQKTAFRQLVSYGAAAEGKVRLHVYAPQDKPPPVAVVIGTSSEQVYHESEPFSLKPGWNALEAPLGKPVWKSQATDWKFGAAVAQPGDIQAIGLVVLNDQASGWLAVEGFEADPDEATAGALALIEKLQDQEAEARAQAETELVACGAVAVPHLKALLTRARPEVAARVESVLDRIGARLSGSGGRPWNLPDLSEGYTGVLGPFVWGRALDLGEDARFSDELGRPSREGEYLWCYQFARGTRKKTLSFLAHARNNFVCRLPEVAFAVQPASFLHNTSGAHNGKLIFGYIRNGWSFQHGDNVDLAHLAGADRVCVFLPVRKDDNSDPLDPGKYFINYHYGGQSFCVAEFGKGEMIHYEWFRGGAGKLDPHVLFDLAPYVSGEKILHPGESKPILRFDVDGKGGWKLRLKRDGRQGLAEPDDDAQYDHIFTHQSPGARPYTVSVPLEDSAWAMSTFSPGGSPTETSEMLIGLKPYDRRSGKAAPWPDRSLRLRDVRVEQLDEAIKRRDVPRKKPGTPKPE